MYAEIDEPTSPHTPSKSSKPKEFVVEIPAARLGGRMGVECYARLEDGKAFLDIQDVDPHCFVGDWNGEHCEDPDNILIVGDKVVRVNGQSIDDRFKKLIDFKNQNDVEITKAISDFASDCKKKDESLSLVCKPRTDAVAQRARIKKVQVLNDMYGDGKTSDELAKRSNSMNFRENKEEDRLKQRKSRGSVSHIAPMVSSSKACSIQ